MGRCLVSRCTWTSAMLVSHQAVTSLRCARLQKVRPLSRFFSTKSNFRSALPLVRGRLSRPCQEHAEYLLKNFDAAFAAQINVHDEDPKLPGYSEAGRKAA